MARKTTTPKKTATKTTTKTTATRRKTTAAAKKTTAPRRSTAAKAPVAKPAAAATAPVEPVETVKVMGKRELIDRVVEASGIKKKAAKPVVEAMLRELGDALSRGETLNLQPFGKGIVKNRKTLENAEVVELRLRRSKQAMAASAASATSAQTLLRKPQSSVTPPASG